jgi:hypothetical protein
MPTMTRMPPRPNPPCVATCTTFCRHQLPPRRDDSVPGPRACARGEPKHPTPRCRQSFPPRDGVVVVGGETPKARLRHA